MIYSNAGSAQAQVILRNEKRNHRKLQANRIQANKMLAGHGGDRLFTTRRMQNPSRDITQPHPHELIDQFSYEQAVRWSALGVGRGSTRHVAP